MTKEQKFFLQLLSDHLNGRKTEAVSGINWDTICGYAADHQVNGIIYMQCRSFLPVQIEKSLSEKYASEIYYHVNRQSLYQQVRKQFSAEKIPFLTFKGLNIAALYPVAALRTMGDCDLLVRPADKDRAHSVMLSLGFQNRLKEEHEWTYLKNDLEFEIHDHLLYDKPTSDKANRESTEQVWQYAALCDGSEYALDWSFHFFYLLLHLKKHLIGTGVGFRQFMDLAVVAKHCDLNLDWLTETLEAQGMLRFAQVCSALVERWFEARLPFAPAQLDDIFYERSTQKVFGNGVFGFQDESNEQNSSLNDLTIRGGPRWLQRVRMLLGSVFPSYRNMRYVPHYSFLNGRPWLLPAAWIYRFYRSIRYRMSENGRQLIGNALISNETLDSRLQELEVWGLRKND